MNTPSALETRTKLALDYQLNAVRVIAKSLWEIAPSLIGVSNNQIAKSSKQGYRLGENVYHGGFGVGRIVSASPDGRLLVRFNDSEKGRLIHPSFLNRYNGCGS